jgi:hypothetical protein
MKNAPRFWLITSMIVAGALLRIAPHPWNFTPIGAMALFAGATLDRGRHAFLVPMFAMLLSDLMLELVTGEGIHSGIPIIYGCFALSVVLGRLIRSRAGSLTAVGAAATASATIFFVVTNFWVWRDGVLYPRTVDGLTSCYIAALPFYRNDLAAHWIYSALLFGGLIWLERRFPLFQRERVAINFQPR